MNISTKISDESLDAEKPRKGYEWWYFDAISTDKKWSLVIIFYQGNPFSTNYIEGKYSKKSEEYPALSISVYKNKNPEFYSFLEFPKSQFLFAEDEHDIHVSIMVVLFEEKTLADTIEYELTLNQYLESGHTIVGKLKFISDRLSGSLIEEESAGDKHYWNLLQPRSKVAGSFKIAGKTIRIM